jgi:peptidyl-prolyl cis-trans isomerase C
MLKTGKFAALAILSALAVNPAFAEDKSVAMVNGVSIPQARVDMFVKNAVAQGQTDSSDLRKNILDGLIDRQIVLQDAKTTGIDKLPEVREQYEALLINSFLQDYAKKHPVTISEDQLKQAYEKNKTNVGTHEYKVSHIQVETEDEARAIIAQLNKKGNFAKIAKEKSKDAGSATHGGSLDWIVPSSNLPPPFVNAMLSLKKGSYTKEPVKSQLGWHVIKLDEVRDLKIPSFEELKPKIQQSLEQQSMQQSIKEYVDELRSKAKIE